MKYFLCSLATCALFFSMMSCNRKVALTRSRVSERKDSISVTADTTKVNEVSTEQKVTRFGDTLSYTVPGYSLQDTSFEDSAESIGIKVKTRVTSFKGTFKVHVQAIAKPVEIVESRRTETTTQKGISATTNVQTDTKIITKDKDTDMRSGLWKLYILVAVLAIIALFIFIRKR